MRNPFALGVLAGGRQLVDREAEVRAMASALAEPGGRLVVYGESRMGKTSALERAVAQARADGVAAAVASLATASDPAEGAQRVLGAVHQALGVGSAGTLQQIAARLKARVEVPAAGPGHAPAALRFTFAAMRDAGIRLLPSVLAAVDAQLGADRHRLGLGLDEFQRALEWGGEPAERALREAVEGHRAVSYVLVGSRRSYIEALSTTPGRAFSGLGETLYFGPVPAELLAEWITRQAACTRVTIPLEASRLIVWLTAGRTRDVLQLARAVWFDVYTRGATDPYLLVQQAFERTVREQDTLYQVVWQRLDARERAVLRAFASDPDIQVMAADVGQRFRLGPKSSVYSAVERLVAAERLARPAPGRYAFDDPYFRRWVQVFGLPDIGEATPPLLPPRAAPGAGQYPRHPAPALAR